MATEEYSVGYDAGYQAGWNEAMDAQTKPPQRTWVGLTEEEKQTCIRQIDELGKYSTHTVADDERLLIDVVESKLRSKNA